MADIVDILIKIRSFSVLVSGFNKAGIMDTLRGVGPFTVFAPTDEAFHHLPAGILESLLQNPTMLRQVLLYHILPARITLDDIKDQDISTVRTLEGENLSIGVTLIGQIKIETATVTRADVVVDNGIIHVINEVLLPASLRRQQAA